MLPGVRAADCVFDHAQQAIEIEDVEAQLRAWQPEQIRIAVGRRRRRGGGNTLQSGYRYWPLTPLALPQRIGDSSLASLQQQLVKTGGRLVKHARYYWLLLAESHLTRRLFGSMVRRIAALPLPTG